LSGSEIGYFATCLPEQRDGTPGVLTRANIQIPRQDLRWICGAVKVIACIMIIPIPRDPNHRTLFAGDQY
jgi:hypothetical protein